MATTKKTQSHRGRPRGKPRTEAEIAANAWRTGRPVTVSNKPVSKGVTMRLTPSEHKTFHQDAKRLNMGLSAYMRYCWQTAREGKDYGNAVSKSDSSKKSRNRKGGKRGG